MARESYVWTDREVELLLNVTLDYKTSKIQEGVDWESCQPKYGDILALFLEQYPTETSEDFPHRKEDVSRTSLTTKLKAVRGKYRKAVDTGRKSGHGRVVLLYFELCEQVWGGSPATTTLSSGVESTDLDESFTPSTSSGLSSLSAQDVGSETEAERGESVAPRERDESVAPRERDESVAPRVKERRDLLHAKLKGHRHERLKRRLPAEVQSQNAVEEDQSIKRRLVEILETSEKQASENFNRLTDTLDRLTASIGDGFALLQRVVNTPPPVPHYSMPFEGRGPYGQMYAHTPLRPYPPNLNSALHTFPHNSTAGNRTRNAVPLSTINPTQQTPDEGMQQFSYTRSLFEDD
ncbi:uncharacterized protein LOC133453999 [Cololabis saira]|uniref:uncharacterized protein LOC133441093 n=1 Tax=Cololabis saira TaxID=129043 RepID=UPI002AD426FE|nr:uncharacterized protein LOC133441093 [Cololabis saira]XP_061589117.1 uncharacterized protein LOC133453999 [Cololabis saira]